MRSEILIGVYLQGRIAEIINGTKNSKPGDVANKSCPIFLVTHVSGPKKVISGESSEYKIISYNNSITNTDKKKVKWKVEIFDSYSTKPIFSYKDCSKRTDLFKIDIDKLTILKILKEWCSSEIRVFPYLQNPIYQVMVRSFISSNLLTALRISIDENKVSFDDLFQAMAEQHIRCCNDCDTEDSFEEMFNIMRGFFVKEAKTLNSEDLDRRQKVYDNFKKQTLEFAGQWDKMKHFWAGAYAGHITGETGGELVAWGTEKVDSIKRVSKDVFGTPAPHQIGFDFEDFEWTYAGAFIANLLTSLEDDKSKEIMKKFANGQLKISTIFKPVIHIKGKFKGFGTYDPLFSPFSETTIDKIDDNLKITKKKILGK